MARGRSGGWTISAWRRIRTTAAAAVLGLCLAQSAALASPVVADASASFDETCARGENALAHGRLENAEILLARALQLANAAGRESAEKVRVRLDLARLQRLQGEPRKARHHLGLASHAARNLYGPESLEMAEIAIERALLHRIAGLGQLSVAAIERAQRIRRARLPAEDPLLLDTLRALAAAHHFAFEYPRAVELYELALERMHNAPAARARDRVVTLNRMAWIFARAGMPERVAALNQRARAIVSADGAARGTSDRLLQLGLDDLPPVVGDHTATMTELLAFIDAWIDEHRFHREHFSVEKHLLVALRRLDREMPVRKVRFALRRDLMTEFLAFAPTRPRVTALHRYGLPFESKTARRVLRESEGSHGFARKLLHAVDFEVPPGTPVIAARDGLVVRVIHGRSADSEKAPSPEEDLRHGLRVNRVIVLHDDETYASYFPLAPQIEIVEGDRVVRGQRIGRTARVKNERAPMIHFDVRRNSRPAGSASVVTAEPVRARFTAVRDRDGIPLVDHAYGGESTPASPAAGSWVDTRKSEPDHATRVPTSRLPQTVLQSPERKTGGNLQR